MIKYEFIKHTQASAVVFLGGWVMELVYTAKLIGFLFSWNLTCWNLLAEGRVKRKQDGHSRTIVRDCRALLGERQPG